MTLTVPAEDDDVGAAAGNTGATVDSGNAGVLLGIRLPFLNFIIGMWALTSWKRRRDMILPTLSETIFKNQGGWEKQLKTYFLWREDP